MKLLALETSSRQASVALFDGDRLVATGQTEPGQRTAAALTPLVQQMLQDAGWRPGDLDLIALTTGPGSFTGLRIGVTMAKTLAYAAAAEVIGLNTLRVIAAQAPADAERISTVMNAQRQEVFAASYRRSSDGELISRIDTEIVPIEEWLNGLTDGELVTGPMLSKLTEQIPPHVAIVDSSAWTPTAETVGRLAMREYNAGERHDFWTLAPRYYRRSYAEEKLT